MNIPLIDELKKEFVLRRVIQTFLGGAKVKLGFKAPIYVYFVQILVPMIPCVFGIFFVILKESNYLVFPQYMYCYGILMFIFVLLTQLVSKNAKRKVSEVLEVKKKSNSLSEGDQIESASCFSAEMIHFHIPPKKHFVNVIFHGLVSAVMCGLCIHFLLPSTIRNTWEDPVVTWIIMIFGWFSVCVAQFPLTTVGAPEPAVYQPLDSYETTAVSRAFYIIAILSIFSSQISHSVLNLSHGMYIHSVLAILPFLWCTNILPPANVLLCWIGEQCLIHLFGGSPQMSNFRLFIMLIISALEFIIIYYIPYAALYKIALVTVGSLLSINIGYVFDKIRQMISNFMLQKSTPFFNDKKSSYFLIIGTHLALTVIAAIVSTSKELVMWNSDWNAILFKVSQIAVVIVWISSEILSKLQSVYLFFGAVRNPLYPKSCFNTQDYSKAKVKLQWFGTFRFFLLKLGLLIAVFHLSLLDHHIKPDCSDWSCWLYIISFIRAYRSIWQNLEKSLFDIVVVDSLFFFEIQIVEKHDFIIVLLVVSFLNDRIHEVLHKLYVVTIITVTSVTLSKQRLWYNWWLVGMDTIFSPIIFFIVILSSVISAPLLPLFTLPIFLISFSRPIKFWPNAASAGKTSSDSICSDAVYYKQLAPRLTSCLAKAIRYGSLGHVTSGNQYVLRFEDRMMWIQVLEHGHNFVTIVMKGLELQETSCHTIEAAELDVLFERAFNFSEAKQCINARCYNCVTPSDTVIVRSYSDAKNVLTGVIDSPTTLNAIPELFPKILSFILFSYCAQCAFENILESKEDIIKRKASAQSVYSTDKLMMTNQPTDLKDKNCHTVNVEVEEKWAEPVVCSSWSDDDDPLGEEDMKRNSATYMTSLSSMPEQTIIPGYTGSLESNDQIMMYEWRAPGSGSDTSKSNDSPELKETLFFEEPPMNGTFNQNFSNIGLKSSWLNTPREKLSKWQHISSTWLQDALKIVLSDDQKFKYDLNHHFSDVSVIPMFQNIITSCTRAFFGENGNGLNPGNVYRTFLGDLQWSLTAEWLRQNEDLMSLALQAYRYCVKLALDKTLFDKEEYTNAELYDEVCCMMNDWFIGPDNSYAWNTAIQMEKSNLFSLGHNSFHNNFTGHLLTLKENPLHIGKLNSEMVRAIWASLNWELLYLTNDDEERYSIQAHPVILRNLTVQAADPPLGYPLYVSSPITMYI